MPDKRVLVIEDDDAIRQGVVDALQYEGFLTLEAGDGDSGMELAINSSYDLLLLDLVLPGHDGFEILRALRASRPTQPVIILTARGQESDRIQGLQMGADDYVVKPFSVKELLARVDAVLRRSAERPTDLAEVKFSGGIADLARCEVRFDDGDTTPLSEREMEILRYLAQNSGRAISREELLARVWRINTRGVETRTVDMHVARLRDKLRDDSANPSVIRTVRGKGYLFAETDQPS